MPSTSEGFEHTGLSPNPVVTKEELEPANFDAQTAEIFLARLNKALGVPDRNPLTDSLLMVLKLKAENTALRDALQKPWSYFHQRFQGLKCGMSGSWEQACDEIVQYINGLQKQVRELTQKLQDSSLQATDRAALVEAVPRILARLAKLESAVFPEVAKLEGDQPS